jgi:Flp pilus assembly protein TadG
MIKDSISKLAVSSGALIKRFREDKAGAAAIEFAFIAPLLITMYLGTMEISQGIEINKKVARSAGVIGDLIGQEDTVTKDKLKDMMAIGQAMLLPYKRSDPKITVSFIAIDNLLNPKVKWSRRGVGTSYSMPFGIDSATTVPANLLIADTYLIRVQTELEYLPITSWSIQKNKGSGAGAYAAIDMSEMYHLRPRINDTVECSDCGTP